ncbi:hypothetical protein V3W47_04555 [Deinococcus sp. YIM 134068]|uniref:hypothetical protein n=1 Tax=Deinococcus lichenicola TaxID=3118910 RepID=UPI002F94D807
MNAHLNHALACDRLQALHAEAQRDREARAARPARSDAKPRPNLLALLRPKPA